MWTLEEQQIVWDDMQTGIPPRLTAKKLKHAGFNRTSRAVSSCRERIKRWGGIKCTYRPPAKKKKRLAPKVSEKSPEYDFPRFMQIPDVIKKAVFPF